MHILWNDEKHSIGISAIDNQHKELISITNNLYDICESGYEQRSILLLIKRLHSYTHYHFLSEEDLFNQLEYPESSDHIAIHKAFTRKIQLYFDELKAGGSVNIKEILEILTNWIGNHIEGEDKKYAEFIKKSACQIGTEFPSLDTNGADSTNMAGKVDDVWTKRKLSLNIHEIDNQHRELVYILQQVNDLNKTGISLARVNRQLPLLIKKLYYYSQFHFDLEEDLMRRNSYPGLGDHHQQHIKFIDDVKNFAIEFHRGKTFLTDEMIHFLKDWTITHILQDDGAFKNYLDARL